MENGEARSKMISVPASWDDLLSRLVREREGTVYVGGACDRGKTTLCRYLAEKLRATAAVAYLDCDTGQSTIGPPTTLGCAVHGATEGVFLRFIGSTSPTGHLLPILAGAKRLQEKAREMGADVIVIDSPGYIEGGGEELQIHLIDLLQPDHVVAIQKEGEFERVLGPFRRTWRMQIHRFTPAPGVRVRSQDLRRRNREALFRNYFIGAEIHEIPLAGIGLHGDVPDALRTGAWQDLLVAVCDGEQFVLALGVVQGVDPAQSAIRILAPAFAGERVASVRVGMKLPSHMRAPLLSGVTLRPSGESEEQEVDEEGADHNNECQEYAQHHRSEDRGIFRDCLCRSPHYSRGR